MPTVISKSPKIYLYGADGLRVLTPPDRKRGELYQHVEVVTYEVLTEREKKLRRKLDAIHRKANGQAVKKVVR